MMKNRRMFVRVSALVAALAVALLLLIGTYAVIASQVPSAGSDLDFPVASSSAFTWSSGWVTITRGTCSMLNHSLGGDPDDYAVELSFLDTDGDLGINRCNYGGLEVSGNWRGAYWQNLTAGSIQVCRLFHDIAADQIRVRVWDQPAEPDYASPWTDINPGLTITIEHNLNITATDLTVALWFSGTNRGIHHFGYGGLAIDEHMRMEGAHWHDLTDNTLQVTHHLDDTDIQQVRVVVVHGAPPDYDSLVDLGGWQDIAHGTNVFTHGLNWDSNMLLVRGECYSSTVGGISQWLAGGNHSWRNGGRWQGTNLQNLTNNTVEIYRQPDDQICPQARVRIWKRSVQTYLPLIVCNYVPTVELAYDDGTSESSQSYTQGNGFAVRFTTPDSSAELVTARYYLIAPVAPIEVHVWDTGHNDLITPFTATPGGDGWFDVDLSGYSLTVNGDFYVGFLYTVDTDPTLGVDTSSSDGRSYEVPWEVKNYDYMIRAVVTQAN